MKNPRFLAIRGAGVLTSTMASTAATNVAEIRHTTNLVYLASTRYNLDMTSEKWNKVGFHASREDGQVMV